ncbi:MAG TPA: hypothetical protein VMY88_06520 [Acidimicrobiales bacterium]|nr:hypothetical protein [Acidimicrobiales bacterium]
MYFDRHRLATLVELSALERTLRGPERLRHEEYVALLVKAAYDDATEPARAEFMARIKTMPETAWPWSTVQSMAPRGGGGDGPGAKVSLSPKPELYAPAALILIRGQAESADADPGNRLPDRAAPEGAAWTPLHKALDIWDTKTILAWIGPQGWMNPAAAQVPKDTGNGVTPPGNGDVKPSSGSDLPVPQPPAPGSAVTWTHPVVLAAGGVVVVVGAVALYNASQHRDRRRLEEALEAQEEQQ